MNRRRLALALLALITITASVLHYRSRASRYADPTVEAGPREIGFLALDDGVVPPSDAANPAAAECVTTLRLRVVGARGEPIGGARVACEFPAASAVSASDGSVALALSLLDRPGPRRARLRASAPGRALAAWAIEFDSVAAVDLGEVVLGAAGLVTGVVASEDGTPVEGAEVRAVAGASSSAAARFSGPRDFVAATSTDANGAFRIDGMPIGPARVWAGASESLWSASDVLAVAERADAGPIELVLHPIPAANVLAISVVDERGSPVPGARLAIRREGETDFELAIADELGRVRRTVEARTEHEVHAIDARGAKRAARAEALESGDDHHVLVLTPPREFVLEVRDPRGEPLERFAASLVCASPFASRREASLPLANRAQGRASVRLPDASFTVTVFVEGRAPVELGPLEPSDVDSPLRVEVAAPPRIRGVALGRGGPVANAIVTLHAANRSGTLRVEGCAARYAPEALASTTTASDGSFELSPESAAAVFVRATASGLGSADFGPVEFDAGSAFHEVRLVLDPASVEGRLLVDPGEPFAGRAIVATRGDGFPRVATTDASGAFRFEGLVPGPWWIGLRGAEPALPEVANVWLAAGATAEFSVVTERPALCSVRGRLAFDGEPARAWTASLIATAPVRRAVRTVALDSDGTFELPSPVLGEVEIELHSPADARSERLLAGKLQLDGDGAQLAFDLTTGRVQGRAALPAARAGSSLAWRAELAGGWRAAGRIEVGSDALFVASRVPAGTVTFVALDPGSETTLRELELPPRTTLDLDL